MLHVQQERVHLVMLITPKNGWQIHRRLFPFADLKATLSQVGQWDVPAAFCSAGNLILLISSCEAAFNCFPACSSSVEVKWEVLSSCRCPLTLLCWWQDNTSMETGTMELFYSAHGIFLLHAVQSKQGQSPAEHQDCVSPFLLLKCAV